MVSVQKTVTRTRVGLKMCIQSTFALSSTLCFLLPCTFDSSSSQSLRSSSTCPCRKSLKRTRIINHAQNTWITRHEENTIDKRQRKTARAMRIPAGLAKYTRGTSRCSLAGHEEFRASRNVHSKSRRGRDQASS